MNNETTYLFAGAAVLLSTMYYFMLRAAARSRAENWLRENRYRVRSFRMAWFGPMTFSTAFRNTDRSFSFIAEVDDTQLGGTGTVRLRVWMDWLGTISQDVEVDWIEMPAGGAGDAEPLMDRLADAQLDILRRVSTGETAFYAPRPNEEGAGAEGFDLFVEHIFALKQRGMLLHGTPVEDGRPGRGLYSSVGSISITPQGRKWLESQA
ncbi:MAG: hypothetical protein ABI681_00865 [Gemmatimonadales bacterium]